MSKNVLIISAFQDYRTAKRASIQQVADGLVGNGHKVTFLSTRYSNLSRLTHDSRLFLEARANRIEQVNGIDCYLWKTLVHPFAPKRLTWLEKPMGWALHRHGQWPSAAVDRMIGEASVIIIESGMAVIYLERIARVNPQARLIYYCTDLLETVGAHPEGQRMLERAAGQLSHVCVRSTKMARHFAWSPAPVYLASFGIHARDFESIGPSPYPPGLHVVSVGSMLFDPSVFAVADAFPEVSFHVIGCGQDFAAPDNVRIYPEMPFARTLPYIRHATLGIAPYRPAPGCEYLDESSLKLAQFELFGLPAVCPQFAVGTNRTRVGYEPGDVASVAAAIREALALVGQIEPRRFPDWETVARQVIAPGEEGLAPLATA